MDEEEVTEGDLESGRCKKIMNFMGKNLDNSKKSCMLIRNIHIYN